MSSSASPTPRHTTEASHVRSFVTSELAFMLDGVAYHRPGRGDKVFNEDFDYVGDWKDGKVAWLTILDFNEHMKMAHSFPFIQDKVHYRRSTKDNKVYDDENEHVGDWNGERIVWRGSLCEWCHVHRHIIANGGEQAEDVISVW